MSNQTELAANNADLEALLEQALAMPTTNEILEQTKEYIDNQLYYKSGDTYESAAISILPALVTGSTRRIVLGITLPKSIAKITSITINSIKGVFRGTTGYIDGITDVKTDWWNLETITTKYEPSIVDDRQLTLSFAKETAYENATNNTTANFYGTISLTFN